MTSTITELIGYMRAEYPEPVGSIRQYHILEVLKEWETKYGEGCPQPEFLSDSAHVDIFYVKVLTEACYRAALSRYN